MIGALMKDSAPWNGKTSLLASFRDFSIHYIVCSLFLKIYSTYDTFVNGMQSIQISHLELTTTPLKILTASELVIITKEVISECLFLEHNACRYNVKLIHRPPDFTFIPVFSRVFYLVFLQLLCFVEQQYGADGDAPLST